jgi:glutathione S-transferase
MGYKNAAWRSREIAPTPPRPGLATILGAFRRTPVLQIGADYVCDTRLILDVIEAVCEAPSLEPARDRAVSELIRWWAEPRVFTMLGAIRFQSRADVDGIFNREVSAEQFSADRLPFMRPAYEPERFPSLADPARDHLERYLTVLDTALSDGPFIGGEMPSYGDFSAHHTVWWLRAPPDRKSFLARCPRIEAWADRIEAFGHGRYTPITDEGTFEAARAAQNKTPLAFDWPAVSDHRLGRQVEVVPDDYGRNPVAGSLVAISGRHVVVERQIEGIGTVRVHFPRLGYEIVAV